MQCPSVSPNIHCYYDLNTVPVHRLYLYISVFETITEPTTPGKPAQDAAETTTTSLGVTWTQPEGLLNRYLVSIDGGETK